MLKVDIERIKEYNNNYKQAQNKASMLKATLDVSTKELDRLCAELSADLGINVTPENAAQIYEEKVGEINRKLELGENILKRIENDEKGIKEAQEIENNIKTDAMFNRQTSETSNVGENGQSSVGQMPSMVGSQANMSGQMPNVAPNVGGQSPTLAPSGVGQMPSMVGSQAPVESGADRYNPFGVLPTQNNANVSGGFDEVSVPETTGSESVAMNQNLLNQFRGNAVHQMFSRNGNNVPSLNEEEYESI